MILIDFEGIQVWQGLKDYDAEFCGSDVVQWVIK